MVGDVTDWCLLVALVAGFGSVVTGLGSGICLKFWWLLGFCSSGLFEFWLLGFWIFFTMVVADAVFI